jgi:hypothetical protein
MDLYHSTYCYIAFDETELTLYLKWLKQPNETILLRMLNKGIDAAIKFQATGWVADNSLGVHLDLSMQRAVAELTASRIKETEITRFARVVPLDVFHELVTHKMIDMINELTHHAIEIEVFSELANARAWVAQQNETLASAC